MGFLSIFVFGLRHGIDWDHIAAITDITGANPPRRSFGMATIYAAGHALVVLLLGSLAILTGDLLTDRADLLVEKAVGLSLVLMAVYVAYSLIKHRSNIRLKSRWALAAGLLTKPIKTILNSGKRTVVEIEHEHEPGADHGHEHPTVLLSRTDGSNMKTRLQLRHRHLIRLPDDPFPTFGALGALLIGMVHGIGAETPTQLLLFGAVAGTESRSVAIALLFIFVAGLLVSNTAIAALSIFGFIKAKRQNRIYVSLAVVTGVFSLALGLTLLLGNSSNLPGLLGG